MSTAAEFRQETERLILRDWRDEDWALFWQHTNTENVMRWLGGVADAEKKAWLRARIEGYQRDHGFTFWVVEAKPGEADLAGELLGVCGLKRCNQPGSPLGDMEIGWRFREDAQGRGYAREAAAECMRIGFEKFAAPHMVALTVASNTPSWGLMKRLGMQRRADLDFVSADFGLQDSVVIAYAITREEWEKTA